MITLYKDIFKFALDLIPDDIDLGISLVGEGATLGIPSAVVTGYLKAVPVVLEAILKGVDTYHKNIGLCKSRFSQIEGRLSSCGYFTEFVIDKTARGEYYELVKRRFEMADEAMVSHVQSDSLMVKSEVKLDNEQYRQAFGLLCDSYSSIGIAR